MSLAICRKGRSVQSIIGATLRRWRQCVFTPVPTSAQSSPLAPDAAATDSFVTDGPMPLCPTWKAAWRNAPWAVSVRSRHRPV
eukprot:365542-Chlamydomonas_euryale.AAC.10